MRATPAGAWDMSSPATAEADSGPGYAAVVVLRRPRCGGHSARPDPEVQERAKRRRFTAEYRMSIVREADAGSRKGELGAMLRREGLYSSTLTAWRHERALHAAAPP